MVPLIRNENKSHGLGEPKMESRLDKVETKKARKGARGGGWLESLIWTVTPRKPVAK